MRAPRDLKPRPLSVSLARFSSAVVICAAMFGAARGATLFWDSDALPLNDAASGAGLGGGGTWNTTTANWWSGGTADTIWNNASLDTAVFAGGTPGTVNLGVPITVGNLVFNTSDYILTGSQLNLGANATITLQDPSSGGVVNATISAPLAGNGLTLNGNGGTLTLNYAGTNPATGTLTIRSGTLQVNAATTTLAAATGVTFKGSGAFRLDNVGALGTTTYGLGALSTAGGDGVVHIERTEAHDVNLTFSSLTPRLVGSTGLFEVNGNGASLTSNATVKFTAGATTGSVLTGYFAQSEGGQTALAFYTAGGVLRELNYNSDPGAIQVVSQTFLPNTHMEMTGSVTSQPAQTIQSLSINGNGPLNLTGLLTIVKGGTAGTGTDVGTLLKVGGSATTISGTGITAGLNRELIIRPDTAADILTISAPITNTTGAVTKSGDGTLILSGANAFTGTTYVNGGKLTIRASGAAGAGTEVVLAGGTYELLGYYAANDSASATLAANKNITVTGSGTLAAGRLTPATDPATNKTVSFGTLTIGNQVLTANPAVYAAGANPPFAGVFALSFTGTTTFTDTLPATFNVTGVQASSAASALTLGGKITGPVGFIKAGTGTLELTNNSTTVGTANDFGGAGAVIEVQQGVLAVSSDAALGNAANSILLNGGDPTDGLLIKGTGFSTLRPVTLGQVVNSIEVVSGATLSLNGVVRSNIISSLIKRGTGTLVLGNAGNVFGGSGSVIDIQAGTLRSASAGALGVSANTVQFSGGTFAATGSFTVPQKFNILSGSAGTIDVASPDTLTISGRITSDDNLANLTKTGTGNLTLTNSANSFGGIVNNVSSVLDIQGGGTLTVTSGGALGDPANTVRLTGGFVGNGTSTASQNIFLAQSTVPATNAVFNVPGTNTFTLGGIFTQTGAVDFTKTGLGTLELTNSNPTLGLNAAPGKIFDVQDGFLGVASDASLGFSFNTIRLGVTGSPTFGGLRALGTFSTSRTITLNDTTSNIDVTQGNMLTLNTAFTLPNLANGIVKGGLGTLTLTASQPTWTGTITINAGAIRASGSAANVFGLGGVGQGTIINQTGSVELANVTNLAEPLTINTPGDNTTMAGASFAGALRGSVGGANVYSGTISLLAAPTADNATRSVVFGVDSGQTVNLSNASSIAVTVGTGGVGRVSNLILGGDGTGSLLSTITKTGGLTDTLQITKTGASVWTVSPANTSSAPINAVEIRSGVFKLTMQGTSYLGPVLPTTATLTFTGGGTFQFDTLGGVVGTKTQAMGPLAFKAGDGITLIQRTVSQNAFLTFSSFSRVPGATGLFQAGGSGSTFSGTPNAKVTFSPALAVGFIDPGLFAQNATGVTTAGFAWYDTTNSTVRPLVYTDTGTASVSTAALLAANTNKHVQVTSTIAVSGTAAIPLLSLNFSANSTGITLAGGPLTVSNGGGTNAGAILKTGNGTATIGGSAGSTLSAGGTGNSELILRTDAGSDVVTISIPIVSTGALTKSGLGTLNLTGANTWAGSTFVNGGSLVIQGASALPSGVSGLGLGGGTFNYQVDGDGTSRQETIDTQKDVTVTGLSTIAVGKQLAAQALNKTVKFGGLTIGNQTLSLSPTNGYGATFSGGVNFVEALPANFNVGGTQASNVVQGMTLTGQITSASGVGFVKSGTGTLVLGNATNTFGGVGGLIDIQGGVIAAGSDGALGNIGNNVALNVTSSSQGFRATGTFATDRIFFLNATSNAIDVTQAQVLTLNKGIDLGGATPNANSLTKINNGVLELGANSPSTWTGTVVINAGAIRLRTGAGLGGAGHAVTIANPSSALQLSGTDQVYNSYPLTLANSGLNNGGALENVSGDNLFTGPISLSADNTVIGSNGGSLTLTGGITSSTTTARSLILGGAGDMILITAPVPALVSSITKIGAGTATLGVASAAYVGNVTVNAGTFAVSGAGKIGGTGTLQLNPGSMLTVDDTGTPSANRLASRTITFTGGSMNLIGSGSGNTSETVATGAAVFSRGLSTITVTSATGRQAVLNFNGSFNNAAPAQNAGTAPTASSVLFRATNLGQPLVNTVITRSGGVITNITHNPLPNTAGITISNGTGAILTFDGQTGATGTLTKGILPWALVDTDIVNGVGTSFATFDSATNPSDQFNSGVAGLNPIRALSLNEQTTILTVNANMLLTSPQAIAATTNFNSLTVNTGGGLTAGALNQITLSSGGILAQPGNLGISGGAIVAAAATAPLNVWTPGVGTSLNISSTLGGGQSATAPGLIKAGAGTLTLSGPKSLAIPSLSANAFNSLTAINQGTLQLTSGNNTLFPNNFVEVGPGGTLDLAGNSQYVQGLFTDGAVVGAGGIVTSSTGTGTIATNYDNNVRNWAGSIQGAVAFSRGGAANSLSIFSDQSYTGITQINGGSTTILRDAGALSGTASIDINFATLNLDNAGGTLNSSNRVKDTAPVTLRGAALTLTGRPQAETTETMGALTVAPGLSTITANASNGLAATGIYSAELTFASLTRQAGSMLNFVGLTNAGAVPLGLIGSNPRVLFTAAPALTSHIIGGWAVVTNPAAVPEFASYVPTVGVGALGTAGFAAYDNTVFPTTDQPTQNIRLATVGPVPVAGRVINSLNLPGVGLTYSSDTSTLNVASGGLIHSGASASIGVPAAGMRGQLTAGTTAGSMELSIYNAANTLTINSRIVDNTAASAVTALVLSGVGTITLAPQTSNTYTGGTTVNNGITVNTTGALAGVTVFPAGGLTLNGATVTTTAAAQIAPTSNLVTLNGSSTLNLVGDNTLSGLTFNNTGGTGTPVVNSGGTLTVPASSTIIATSSNVTTTATIAGRFALPTGTTTFDVAPIMFNGVQVAPTQATLVIQGIGAKSGAPTIDDGGINKTGLGVLQFNAQELFTGPVHVIGGGIQFGVGNGGSRFANVNLDAGTRINLATSSGVIGSLSGAAGSVVTNNTTAGQTLTVGFDGTSTTFGGRFLRFGESNANVTNLTKIGAGTMTLTGAGSDSTATLSLQGGGLTYSGAASTSFAANNILTGSTLTLDNAGTNVNNRLGGLNANAVTLSLGGGTMVYKGNNAADTSETINVFTVGVGVGGGLGGASVLDLQPNANHKMGIVVSTTFTALQVGASLFIKNLPTLPDADYIPANGKATIDLGTIALNAPAGQGTGFPETQMAIRPDIVASVGVGLPATEFVTKDPFSNLLRPLASLTAPLANAVPEVSNILLSGSVTPTNYDLPTGLSSLSENTIANSLVLQNGAGINDIASSAHGVYGPNATLLTQTVISGGILTAPATVGAGGTNSITVGLLTTGTNVPLTFHAYTDLAVNANVGAGTGGLTKSGTGTLTISGRGFYQGVTTVNDGVLVLNGPQDNNIAVIPQSTTALTSALTVNGGMIDLNGHSQAFGTLSSNNPNANVGGEVTNSALGPVTLTSSTGTGSTFSGKLTGNLDFVKSGNSTLTLTGASTFTGTATIRGGGISLRDQGSLGNNLTAVDINYGTLTVDQTQLNPTVIPVRVKTTVPITLFGGTLTHTAGSAMDFSASFGSITLAGGANAVISGVTQNAGSTGTVNLANLSHPEDTSTINFAPGGGTLGNAGFNNPHLFLAKFENVAVTPATLTNNILGGWAITNGSDFSTLKGTEIGGLGNTVSGFAAYDGVDVTLGTTTSASNINDGTTRNLIASKTINSLRVAPNAANTLTLGTAGAGAAVVLTLNSGGLLTNNNSTYAIAAAAGATNIPELTAGPNAGGDLYLFINQNTTTIGVKISDGNPLDNPVGVTLVKGGAGALTLTGVNTYTGPTVVNQGTLTLSTPLANGGSIVAVPGALMINNATTTLTSSNQLKTTADVTIDGAGVLNTASAIPQSNTLGSVTFNNRGGNAAPAVAVSTNLNLGKGGGTPTISANNDVFSTTPTISGNSLTLSNAQPVISTSGLSPTSLLITAPMHPNINGVAFGGEVVKTGPGTVALNPTIGLSATTTSTTLTSSPILSNLVTTDGLAVGMSVSGTNITAGSVITQILNGGTDVLLSLPTTINTGTATNTITFTGSTFTNGFRVNQGGLILAASSVLDPSVPINSPIINGPVGVGTLTLANGSAIMSDNTLRTLHNAVSVLGDFTFGPPAGSEATAMPGNGVNLAGPMTLSSGAHTITVRDPLNISTISGLITGTSGTLTKAGAGTLVLSSAGNNWGGALAVTGGVLRNAVAGAIRPGIDLSVSAGAVFDTPGVNQTVKTLTGSGAVTNSSPTLASVLFVGGTSQTDVTTVANSTFDGSISGFIGGNTAGLGFAKVGAGTLTLTGASTYTGQTDVNSGTLRVALSGSLRIASNFTVHNGATADIIGSVTADSGGIATVDANSRIRGSGTLASNVTIADGGIIEPVLSGVNVLTLNNNKLDIQDNATVFYTADAATANRIRITGSFSDVTLESLGTWKLQLAAGNVTSPVGKTFTIFDGDDGAFSLLNGNDSISDNVGHVSVLLPPGWSFNTSLGAGNYGLHFNTQKNDIVLIGVVPEPGSGTLFMGGLAAALGLQRFRRRHQGAAAC